MKNKWIKKGFVILAVSCLAFGVTGCDKGGEVVNKVLEKTNLKEKDTQKQEIIEETVPEVEVAKPELTVNLSGSVSYQKGDPADPLKIEAKTSDSGVITYQWYSSQTNTNGGGTLIDGATNSTYVPPTEEEGTMYYYAVATSTIQESTNGVTSETAEVIVTAEAEEGEAEEKSAETAEKSQDETSQDTKADQAEE